MAKRLMEYGYRVFGSDVVKRGESKGLFRLADFLKLNIKVFKETDIVTNPPYKYAKEFVLKALEQVDDGRKVCMFLKLTFLEGKARLQELFSKYPPKRIWVFSERVMCAKNGNFEGMRAGGGSAVAYAWFIWEKGYKGETTIGWL